LLNEGEDQTLSSKVPRTEQHYENGYWRLSPRELEVLQWTAKGKTYTEISMIIGVSFGSVKTYLDSVRHKINAVNVAHAVAIGYEKRLLTIESVTCVPTPEDLFEETPII
jgi:DNA-binding CsgD family transcriptional regulator